MCSFSSVFNFASITSVTNILVFNFNEALLASGVNINIIRGICDDGTEEMFWEYRISFLSNFTVTCNGSYVFQALSRGGMPIGFPFTVPVDSPTNTGEFVKHGDEGTYIPYSGYISRYKCSWFSRISMNREH